MTDHNIIARDILSRALAGGSSLTSKEAGFLGQMAFDANPPSEKQGRWLNLLADRYGKKEAVHG